MLFQIMYYGMIQQATGEDWNDAKLSLSTAMPSVGGTVPDLGTQRLNFKPKAWVYNIIITAFKECDKYALSHFLEGWWFIMDS